MPTWVEALQIAVKNAPDPITNQTASGLLLFARDVVTYAAKQAPGFASPVDVYGMALEALGWTKAGDQFDMSPAWRAKPYTAWDHLLAAMGTLAAALDAAKVPFKLVRDPAGTIATYRDLATWAWAKMKAETPAIAQASTDAKKQGALAARTDKPKATPTPAAKANGGKSSGSGAGFLLLALALLLSD